MNRVYLSFLVNLVVQKAVPFNVWMSMIKSAGVLNVKTDTYLKNMKDWSDGLFFWTSLSEIGHVIPAQWWITWCKA